MKDLSGNYGPVVIGGVGGSGTRVVAEILLHFGFFMGKDLNPAKDNLSYTLLFKRPEWFKKNFQNKNKLETGFSILNKSLYSGESLSIKEKIFLWNAVRDMAKHGHNREGQGKGDWAKQRAAYIKFPQRLKTERYKGWGWKEPNSHLLIPVMAEYFPDFKYVHTVRHGLDMAYSGNQQQLYNWGDLFGIDIPEKEEDVPAASFRYWTEVNKKVLAFGEQLGNERFLQVNFDRLCEAPEEGIMRIADFLKVNIPEDVMKKAFKLPVLPESKGRYKDYPLDGFSPEDLDYLEKMGFDYR